MRAIAFLHWFVWRVTIPLTVIGGAFLHIFTAYTAFQLAPELWGCLAGLAAWITPGISEIVVAYKAWRVSGSKVNGYSIWVLVWMGSLVATAILARIDRVAQQANARRNAKGN